MIITTAGRSYKELEGKAKDIALELDATYIRRNKQSVSSIQSLTNEDCIVVGQDRLELYPFGEKSPFFFHPNSAMFRIKRVTRGEHDPFVDAAKLESGMSFLDCTLGLASDSIVASYVIGRHGLIVGIEANRYLAFIVKKGLHSWDSGISEMNLAMEKLKVINANSKEFLVNQKDNSFDVVYIDPMFEESILESDGIQALTKFASYEDIDEGMIREALRVARRRVVLKDHFRSTRFEKYGFFVYKRKTSKFHFGVLEKKQ